jgi:hypothetical protein
LPAGHCGAFPNLELYHPTSAGGIAGSGGGSCRRPFPRSSGRRRGVAADQGRHDRGIDHAQAFEAMHAQRESTTAIASLPILQVPTG